MSDGFLGTRASLMLDLVVVTMVAAVPLLLASIFLVRDRRLFVWHRNIQLALATVLLVALVAFEVDLRIFGWRERALPSQFWIDGPLNDWIDYSLVIHLCFAIPTPLLWAWVIYGAWRKFPRPIGPNAHSRSHLFWGRLAVLALILTSITGWCFYWCAFAA